MTMSPQKIYYLFNRCFYHFVAIGAVSTFPITSFQLHQYYTAAPVIVNGAAVNFYLLLINGEAFSFRLYAFYGEEHAGFQRIHHDEHDYE